MNRSQPSNVQTLAALIGIQVLFGLNYSISKLIVDSIPPLIWASVRGMIAFIAMIFICHLLGRSRRLDKSFIIGTLGFSFLGIVINQGCFLVGLRYTTSANSAILNSLIPLFTLLLLILKKQESFTWKRGIGFACAFTGVLIILRVEEFSLSSDTLIGDVLTIINCISFAIYLSYSKNFLQRYDPLWTTGWLFFFGSIGLGLIAGPQWRQFEMPVMSSTLIGCIAYAIIAGTIVVYFLNNWLLVHIEASRVASFIYLQPVVASLLGCLWLGEVFTWRVLFSGVLIIFGVMLTSKNNNYHETLRETEKIRRVNRG